MKAPIWLLLLFPHRFAHDQGEAWKSTVEDLWANASAQGWRAQVAVLAQLVFDCARYAPVAHLAAIRQAILGPVPVMVLAGADSRSVSNAWFGYVNTSLRDVLVQAAGFLMAGALAFFTVYWVASTNWSFLLDGDLWRSSPSTIMTSIVLRMGPLLLAFPLVVRGGAWFKRYVRERRGSVLMALLVFFTGFDTAAVGTFGLNLSRISGDIMETYAIYPQSKNFPVEPLKDTDPATWTTEQHQWFDPATGRLLEERRAMWCAQRQGWLNSERARLAQASGHSLMIDLILWSGSLAATAAEGCIDTGTWLEQTNTEGVAARDRGGNLTWRGLGALDTSIDSLEAAPYITWPSVIPGVFKVCTAAGHSLASQQGRGVDDASLVHACEELDARYGRQSDVPLGALVTDGVDQPRWWMGSNTKEAMIAAQDIRALDRKDLAFIEARLMTVQDQWLKP